MKVLFIKNVKGVGKIGDTKEVADGYGRNYLIKNGIATLATAQSLAHVKKLQESQRQSMSIKEEQAKEIAHKLTTVTISFHETANEEGHLYGSVDAEKIVEELKRHKIEIEPEHVALEHPIKTIGTHTITLNLHQNIQAALTAEIIKK